MNESEECITGCSHSGQVSAVKWALQGKKRNG